jgi:hypothetical protein
MRPIFAAALPPLLALALALALAPNGVASATTLRVPRDFPNLTEAVRFAHPGDEIALGAGTWSVSATGEELPLVLARTDVRIVGEGAGVTVLDGEGASRLFEFVDGDRSQLVDLSLAGGFADDGRAALAHVSDASPELLRVVLSGGRGNGGGDALSVAGGSPRLAHCLLTRGIDGPTVRISGGEPVLTHVTVSRNAGEAVVIDGAARPALLHSVIADPGTPAGPAVGLRLASADAVPRLENVLWSCWDGAVERDDIGSREQDEALAAARDAEGLRQGDPGFVDPAGGDFHLRDGALARRGAAKGGEELGAYGGQGALGSGGRRADRGGGPSLLDPASPNPLSLSTTVSFRVLAPSPVDLGVYNVLGQRVRTLHAGDLPAGEHTREWDGRDDLGEDVPPGIYFVRVTQRGETESRRVVLVR